MNSVQFKQSVGNIQLQKACLFFGSAPNNLSLVTINDVEIINQQPIIKEGKIASKRSLKTLASRVLKQDVEPLTLLQDGVLAKNQDIFVWWVPSAKRRVYFRTHDQGLENVSGEVIQPSLVFAKTKSHWYVLAFAGITRPTAETPLLFSPYFNVWDQHNICAGSTAVPQGDDVDAWTKAFFASAFTHSNYRSKASKLKLRGERAQLWRNLFAGKYKTKFPTKVLPSAGLTLGQFLQEINQHE